MSEIDLLKRIKALETAVKDLARREFAKGGTTIPYSDTSTIIGWSSFTVKQIIYYKIGQLVFVQYRLTGTSDATTTSFTLPYANNSGVTLAHRPARAEDNGAWINGGENARVGNGSDVLSFYIDEALTGWTASGTKHVEGTFCYVIS